MKEVGAQEACEIQQEDPSAIYLDVRSVPEFQGGHPTGSINIPIMHFTPGVGMSPNEEFLSVVETTIPKDARLLVGCKTGIRSARACELLAQRGYTNLTNVRGGYVGVMNPAGQVIEPGWSLLDLPTSTEASDSQDYESLLSKTKGA